MASRREAGAAVHKIIAVLAAIAVGLAAAFVLQPADASPPALPPLEAAVPAPSTRARWIDVTRASDASKPGVGRSVMGELIYTQEPRTTGPSPDSLRFRFDQPAELLGVVISVDIAGPDLVEVVAGVNVEAPYGVEELGDGKHQPFVGDGWLLHTSDSNGGEPSKIDEQYTLPVPVAVEAGDWVSVDTWIGNHTTSETSVSPEVILFYRWT